MKALVLVIVVSLPALGAGRARSDWIEQTLVTADVTGVWRNVGGFLELTLEQEGPKVTGSVFQRVFNVRAPITGTVTGDVFKFQATGTNAVYEGELTVDGDEMKGYTRSSGGRVNTVLRRTEASTPARQP
jgi:hypothetical protein